MSPPESDEEIGGMEIPEEGGRRLVSWVMFLVAVLAVALLLVVLFIQFTASLRIALALVTFMLIYMGIMSYWVIGRDDERR